LQSLGCHEQLRRTRLKLRAAGLSGFLPGGQGGFGSDSEDRARLPEVARRRAGTASAPHPRDRTVVIGDTPRDIACARGRGARARGGHRSYRVEDLGDADAVAPDGLALRGLVDGLPHR